MTEALIFDNFGASVIFFSIFSIFFVFRVVNRIVWWSYRQKGS